MKSHKDNTNRTIKLNAILLKIAFYFKRLPVARGANSCINARRARATAFPYKEGAKEDLVSRARV